MSAASDKSRVRLVVYKEIAAGDLKKFTATSNITRSGGGARDLRFSPVETFFPVFQRMFTRDGPILRGRFSWAGRPDTALEVHPPSNARPNEVRITRVHECFPAGVIPSSALDCVLLLVLDTEGRVFPCFTSRDSLTRDGWHPAVATPVLSGLDARRGKRSAAMGFVDFENGGSCTMDTLRILQHLQERKNVLLTGAPGTGKSKLMNDTALAFASGVSVAPVHRPGAAVPIPAAGAPVPLPMMQRTNRRVFRTTLHQNSKYRDFLTGITPRFDGTEGYQISSGILYRANEFAKQPDSAALLIVDELNRGPAVEVFGGSIAAIEPDKRLSEDNTPTPGTQYFELLSPETGENQEYAFSPHLYLLAAMNQADVSVAPLDVAFLRRWRSVPLYPDYGPLYQRFGITAGAEIPETNPTPRDVYHAAARALEAVNRKITAGRGPEYQLGQGVFLSARPHGPTVDDALDFVLDCWEMIYAHIQELFFGEPNALAYLLNAGREGSPYSLEERSFAGDTRAVLTHAAISRETVYGLYRSLLESER